MNLSKNIAISFLIILNILLILKLNKFQTKKNTYIKNNIDLKHQLELHKNYGIYIFTYTVDDIVKI